MSAPETGTPPPHRKRDLSTEQACRRALAAYVNDIDAGNLDPKKANSMFYGISILIGSFRDERLEEIERQLAEIRQMGASAT